MSLISEKIVKKFNVKVKRTFKNPISVHSTVLSFGEKLVLRTGEYTNFRRTVGRKLHFQVCSIHIRYFLFKFATFCRSNVILQTDKALHYGTNQSRLLFLLCRRQLFPRVRRQTRAVIFRHNFTADKKIGCFKATDSVFTMFISIRPLFISIPPAHRKRCPP